MGGTRERAITADHGIDVVEAAYALDGSDQAWLDGIVNAARADLEGVRGSVCKRADVDRALLANLSFCGEVLAEEPAVVVFAQDAEGFGILLSAPRPAPIDASPRVRDAWRRVALHIATAMRLRRRLTAVREDAMLSPEGELLHAEADSAKTREAQTALATAVRRMSAARTRTQRRDVDQALELWRGLVAGEWSLVDRWDGGRRYLAAFENRPAVKDPRRLTRREQTLLHYVSLGANNKEIAFALGVPMGSVSAGISTLMKKLACARRSDLLEAKAPDSEVPSGPLHLPDSLSAAERDIVQRIADGATNVAIAKARGTSPNTISNQLQALYGKLGVSSRAELVARMTKPVS